ncbi:hypothetical protein, partial [Burkholderia oklahomensis]|uniref:hypothetical protein n=1 Tax=Burkholderia oklahomensis TaxID=342113 RepID=UPI00016A9BBE
MFCPVVPVACRYDASAGRRGGAAAGVAPAFAVDCAPIPADRADSAGVMASHADAGDVDAVDMDMADMDMADADAADADAADAAVADAAASPVPASFPAPAPIPLAAARGAAS